jgi:hypothetical protein
VITDINDHPPPAAADWIDFAHFFSSSGPATPLITVETAR